jgi:hypothetical protein
VDNSKYLARNLFYLLEKNAGIDNLRKEDRNSLYLFSQNYTIKTPQKVAKMETLP